ncbi:NEQ423 [Nanoarchaeum equitans Kin4-M]|uniref:Probable tRNA sulfurtransferase n=1 Tax=Nanoarchaeum equitans (strain Kin4-M) TaxID=228908 RepID=Q74MY1_NANEQ|nr:NEQ423 [Nanoarchaeum equitans Kin4-M]
MFYNAVLASWGEIFLKGERSKKGLLKLLIKDIKRKVPYDVLKIDRGLFIFKGDVGEIIRKLKLVPGINKIYPALEVEKDLESIKKYALELAKRLPRKTFKIKVIRADKNFPYNSLEIAKIVGSYIEKNSDKKVNLKNPDNIIRINIRDKVYIYYSEEKGLGGLPYGSEGKALSLFSGGFDSTLTAIFAIKRGVIPIIVYFNPFDDFIEKTVYEVYEKIKEFSPDSIFISIPFSEVYYQLLMNVEEKYRQILLKIIMHKTAKALAKKLGLKSIFIGESIGQKSTQTLKSLETIDSLTLDSISVFRPIAGLDKEEVIEYIRELGLYDYVIKVKEMCALGRKTVIEPKEEIIKKWLDKIDINIDSLIKEAKTNLPIKSYEEELDYCENPISIWKFIRTKKGDCIYCKEGTLALTLKKALKKRGIEIKAMKSLPITD